MSHRIPIPNENTTMLYFNAVYVDRYYDENNHNNKWLLVPAIRIDEDEVVVEHEIMSTRQKRTYITLQNKRHFINEIK